MHRMRQLMRTNSELLKNNEDLKKIISHVKHIDEKVSYKGYRPLRYALGTSAILLYVNREKISNIVSNKAKNLTQETIEDDVVKLKAQETITQLVNSEETKKAVYDMFQSLFDDPKVQESLSVFLKEAAIKTMNDDEFKKTTNSFCWDTIKGSLWRSSKV